MLRRARWLSRHMASQCRQCELCLRPHCQSLRCLADLASDLPELSDGAEGGSWWETGPAMAYSRTSHRFLVAWRTVAYGVSGRLIDSNGTLLSGVVPLAPPAAGTGSRDPALAGIRHRRVRTDDTGWTHGRCAGDLPADSCRGRLRAGDGPISVFRVERSRRQSTSTHPRITTLSPGVCIPAP